MRQVRQIGNGGTTGIAAAAGDGGAVLGKLEAMLSDPSRKGLPPVERWEPECRGNIGLAIAADGVWSYQGSPIARPALVRLFASVLRKDTDGKTYLVTPSEKVEVNVADAPFLAVELEAMGSGREQRLALRTNLDDIVVASDEYPIRFAGDPATEGLKPYIRVRGRLEALMSRAVYYDLVDLAVEEAVNGAVQFGVWSSGRFFAMAPVAGIAAAGIETAGID